MRAIVALASEAIISFSRGRNPPLVPRLAMTQSGSARDGPRNCSPADGWTVMGKAIRKSGRMCLTHRFGLGASRRRESTGKWRRCITTGCGKVVSPWSTGRLEGRTALGRVVSIASAALDFQAGIACTTVGGWNPRGGQRGAAWKHVGHVSDDGRVRSRYNRIDARQRKRGGRKAGSRRGASGDGKFMSFRLCICPV